MKLQANENDRAYLTLISLVHGRVARSKKIDRPNSAIYSFKKGQIKAKFKQIFLTVV